MEGFVSTGLVCLSAGLLAGFAIGKRSGKNEALKKLRVPKGHRITAVHFERIR